jgi:aerobic C4-dicarboxylate transport protein
MVANVVQPGAGLNIDPATLDAGQGRRLCRQGAREHDHRLPDRHHPGNVRLGAFVEGNILQVLFVSILFGIALALVGERGGPC